MLCPHYLILISVLPEENLLENQFYSVGQGQRQIWRLKLSDFRSCLLNYSTSSAAWALAPPSLLTVTTDTYTLTPPDAILLTQKSDPPRERQCRHTRFADLETEAQEGHSPKVTPLEPGGTGSWFQRVDRWMLRLSGAGLSICKIKSCDFPGLQELRWVKTNIEDVVENSDLLNK